MVSPKLAGGYEPWLYCYAKAGGPPVIVAGPGVLLARTEAEALAMATAAANAPPATVTLVARMGGNAGWSYLEPDPNLPRGGVHPPQQLTQDGQTVRPGPGRPLAGP